MKPIADLNVAVLKHIFKYRFNIAHWTKENKTFGKAIYKMLFDKDDMIVLPKDSVAKSRTIETDIPVDSPESSTVLPSEVVKELIRSAGHIFIMNFCLCRKCTGCKDYPTDHGCIFLGNGVHKIPPEYGRLATAEEAVDYIDECSALGLVHIIGRNKIDHIWMNLGMKVELMTICNCCPCCCLWKVVNDISNDIGDAFRRMRSVEVTVDPLKCTGCGVCVESCFTSAVNIVDGVCNIVEDLCRGCGRCVENCLEGAISLTYDRKAINQEIAQMKSLANLS